MDGPYKILLVDDDLDFLNLLSESFTSKGHNVTSCPDGFSGLAALAQETFDVIISDYIMPNMDGEQFAVYAKANIKNQKTPIFLLSGRFNDERTKQLENLGIFDWLPKPLDFDSLMEKIDRRILGPKEPKRYHPSMEDIMVKTLNQVLGFYFKNSVNVGSGILQFEKKIMGKFNGTVALFGSYVYGALNFSANNDFANLFCQELFKTNHPPMVDSLYDQLIPDIAYELGKQFALLLSHKDIKVLSGLPESCSETPSSFFKLPGMQICFPVNICEVQCYSSFLLGDPRALETSSSRHHALPIFDY